MRSDTVSKKQLRLRYLLTLGILRWLVLTAASELKQCQARGLCRLMPDRGKEVPENYGNGPDWTKHPGGGIFTTVHDYSSMLSTLQGWLSYRNRHNSFALIDLKHYKFYLVDSYWLDLVCWYMS